MLKNGTRSNPRTMGYQNVLFLSLLMVSYFLVNVICTEFTVGPELSEDAKNNLTYDGSNPSTSQSTTVSSIENNYSSYRRLSNLDVNGSSKTKLRLLENDEKDIGPGEDEDANDGEDSTNDESTKESGKSSEAGDENKTNGVEIRKEDKSIKSTDMDRHESKIADIGTKNANADGIDATTNKKCNEVSTCTECADLTMSFAKANSNPDSNIIGCQWNSRKVQCGETKIINITDLAYDVMCKTAENNKLSEESNNPTTDESTPSKPNCDKQKTCSECHDVNLEATNLKSWNDFICWWEGDSCVLSNASEHSDMNNMCAISNDASDKITTKKGKKAKKNKSKSNPCSEASSCRDCYDAGQSGFVTNSINACWWNGASCTSVPKDAHSTDEIEKMCDSVEPQEKASDNCKSATTCSACLQQSDSILKEDSQTCWWSGTQCELLNEKKDNSLMCSISETTKGSTLSVPRSFCESRTDCNGCADGATELKDNVDQALANLTCWWDPVKGFCNTTKIGEQKELTVDICSENGPNADTDDNVCGQNENCEDCRTSNSVDPKSSDSFCLWKGEKCVLEKITSVDKKVVENMCPGMDKPAKDEGKKTSLNRNQDKETDAESAPEDENTDNEDDKENPPKPSDTDSTPVDRSKTGGNDTEEDERKPNNEDTEAEDETAEPTPSPTAVEEKDTNGADKESSEVKEPVLNEPATPPSDKGVQEQKEQQIDEYTQDESSPGLGSIFVVACIAIGGYLIFKRCKTNGTVPNYSSVPTNGGHRPQSHYQGVSTHDDTEDEEWGWDDAPKTNNSSKVEITGMKLQSSLKLMHRQVAHDKNGDVPVKPRRSLSSQSRTSSHSSASPTTIQRDGLPSIQKIPSPVQKKVPVQTTPSLVDQDDFFEQMGLVAKPKFTSTAIRPLQQTQSKHPIIIPGGANPKPSSQATITFPRKPPAGTTAFSSATFDDTGNDNWSDDDADLDDLLKD